nr:tetratricopeptide repeat protein [uncultured Undibacterium sp.]
MSDNKIANLMEEIVRLYSTSQFEQLEALLRQAIQHNPKFGISWKVLAIVLKRRGQMAEATTCFHNAMLALPNDLENLNNYRDHCLDLGETLKAQQLQQLAITADAANNHFQQGLNLHTQKKWLEAANAFGKCIALSPNFAAAHSNLAVCLQELGELSAAIVEYKTALQLAPDDAVTHCGLANTLLLSAEFLEADSHYQQAIVLAPDSLDAHFNRGNCLLKLDQQDEAIKHFKDAIRLKPHFGKAQFNLANCQLEQDDHAAAKQSYLQTLQGDSVEERLQAAVYIAVLSFLEGDLTSAKALLDAAAPIKDASYHHLKAACAYWLYLRRLLAINAENAIAATIDSNKAEINTLHVIGDSHTLSLHGQTFTSANGHLRAQSHWVWGCKQWHLAQAADNKFKRKFQRILGKLPTASKIMISVGEIDARADEGILVALQKRPLLTLHELVIQTCRPYLQWIKQMAALGQHQVIISSVPLALDASPQRQQLINEMNQLLRDDCLTLGFGFLDLDKVSRASHSGAASPYFLDGVHLAPAAYRAAFEDQKS